MVAWVKLSEEGRYPVLERCMPYNFRNTTCSYLCRDTDPRLKRGKFEWQQLKYPWEVRAAGGREGRGERRQH